MYLRPSREGTDTAFVYTVFADSNISNSRIPIYFSVFLPMRPTSKKRVLCVETRDERTLRSDGGGGVETTLIDRQTPKKKKVARRGERIEASFVRSRRRRRRRRFIRFPSSLF